MSSHHEWVKEIIEQHDLKKPFAPENGKPLKFKVGDVVIYKNEYGVTFCRRVTGIYYPYFDCSLYACGARYFLDKNSHWMPVAESSLCLLDEDSAHTSTN